MAQIEKEKKKKKELEFEIRTWAKRWEELLLVHVVHKKEQVVSPWGQLGDVCKWEKKKKIRKKERKKKGIVSVVGRTVWGGFSRLVGLNPD